MPETRINTGFRHFCPLFKLANKSLSLYIFVSASWFYLVLYVFNCPKSIGCTERCYQFVIIFLLSIKNSRNVLILVDNTIYFYILVAYLVDNHIIFPYRIFIICPKADPFGEIRPHSRKHLKVFKFTVNFLYGLCCIFFVIFSNIISDVFKSFATIGLIRNFNILFPHKCF